MPITDAALSHPGTPTTADADARPDRDTAEHAAGLTALGIPDPDSGPRGARSSVASLRRLYPYARPALPALLWSTVTAIVATVCSLAFPLAIQWIIDGPITDRDLSGLVWPAVVLVLLGAGEAGLFWVRRLLAARPSMQVEARMREALYAHLQRLPVAFHDHWPAGQLLSRAVSDLSTIRRFLGFALVFLVVNVATFVVGVIILLSLSWRLGLVVAALAVPLIVLCLRYETRYQVLARRSQDQVGDLATTVEESVLGIRILKAFGRSRDLGRSFLAQARGLRDTELTKARVISVLWATIIALPEIALGVVLLLGIQEVADGTLTAGTLVAFFGTAMSLRWPIDSLGWLLAVTNDAAAAADRYFEVMDVPVTVTSPERPVRPARREGHLEFRDVRFGFPDAQDRPGRPAEVLRGVDLELHPGESVAVVGATGSGKTALTALVNRLYDVTGGAVVLDGVDVRDLDLADLRSRVAVAFEEPTLFSASVRENVLLGHPDADDDEVRRALRVAHADFVEDLPWGLDTRIGEQGLSLSGGQRQRLALARAVVGRPSVLVMDDPLSALDIHTEAQVEKALRSVLHGTTALIVAHRASTVLLADRVALLADGRVAAVGTHSELLATVPGYGDLLATDARGGADRTDARGGADGTDGARAGAGAGVDGGRA
ncbi:ABC transporter ATP-binding protein [Nakamurella endophytica]|uniref:ABC transporter ATP-binding protein n=1 Tax=Nakamurella endophytica TaxID=1748367 RepID=A0A917SLY0_9ACTN|nr:ABC transporter ATP-binding protein [Nakamurella endophytica]GGL88667.1 ABC transporter ATP-binding protein [Nakamurella endophytica]